MTKDDINWPDLPEGYFFRVKSLGDIYPVVELRKKTLLGSKLILFDSPVKGYFHTETEEIEHISKMLSDKFHRNLNRYYGDSK